MKKMLMLLLVTLMGGYFVSSIYAKENDFDAVCGYFQELKALPKLGSLDHSQRNDFIVSRLKSGLPESSNARAAWEAISNASPEMRYDLFVSAANSVGNKTWSCLAMEYLAPNTGEF